MVEKTETMIAEYRHPTPYGLLTMQVWLMQSSYDWVVVYSNAEWLGEWAYEDDANEIWEELNPYTWEDPDNCPTNAEEYANYLAWCAGQVTEDFEGRVARAVEELEAVAERYYQRYNRGPDQVWLVENFPHKGYGFKPTPKFRQRVAEIVWQKYSAFRQMSLF